MEEGDEMLVKAAYYGGIAATLGTILFVDNLAIKFVILCGVIAMLAVAKAKLQDSYRRFLSNPRTAGCPVS
jgi:hypothetical protein